MILSKTKTWNGADTFRYAHYKLDGHYARVVRDEFGAIRVYSVKHEITEKVKHRVITEGMLSHLPNCTELHGELWFPGACATDIATRIAEDMPLRFACFATDQLSADASLEELRLTLGGWGVPSIPFVPFNANLTTVYGLPYWLGTQIEGYIFKNSHLGNWTKWKPVKTIDCVVTGYRDGEGKYLGLVGALLVSVQGREIASVSGMSDDQRAEMTIAEDGNLGRVCEVAYQCVGSQGRLRHPRFVRWRDDKEAEKCLLEQDHELTRCNCAR